MKLGSFDRHIVIESYTETADSYGEKVKTWSTYHSCYANLNTTGGTENITAEKITGRLNTNWTIRYKSGINEKMRVKYNSEYYQITAVLLDGRDNRMILQSYKI